MIRVLLVDDDALVRAGLRMILSCAPDIDVVAEVDDGEGVQAALDTHAVDVVLMDIRMRRVDGLTATARARPQAPAVLVLTTFHLDEYVFGALEAGASGFLLKDTPPTELVEAVRVVAAGDAMLSPTDTRALLDRYTGGAGSRREQARRALAVLSPREREVATAVARGLSNVEIAAELFCSQATIKAHLAHIYTKLGVGNRVGVAILAHDAH